MRSPWITLPLLTLLACGEGDDPVDVGPDGETPDAAPESDAGMSNPDGGPATDVADAEAGALDFPETPQIALSGALTASVENGTTSASWSKSSDLTSLLHLPAGGAPLLVGFTFTFKGIPRAAHTYDETQSDFSCALTVTRASDNASWVAARSIPRQTDQGTCSLSLDEVEESLATATLKQFAVHGSVQGTLPAAADGGAEGSVTMHATF